MSSSTRANSGGSRNALAAAAAAVVVLTIGCGNALVNPMPKVNETGKLCYISVELEQLYCILLYCSVITVVVVE